MALVSRMRHHFSSLRIQNQIISLELQRLHDSELLKSRGTRLIAAHFAIMTGRAPRVASHHHEAPAPQDWWVGGASRDRTDDLLLAKQALSQLSYGPRSVEPCSRRSSKWWVWEELNLRPHPYQGCALTN